ncbi:MAG: alpha-glucosidase, partial [Candidatus Heimdallarchaeaceae archaeon]
MIRIKQEKTIFQIYFDELLIFRHTKTKPMIILEEAENHFSMKHGMFKIKERVRKTFRLTEIEIFEKKSDGITLKLYDKKSSIQVYIILTIQDNFLEISFRVPNNKINRIILSLAAKKDEAIFGCGEQFSRLNLRGCKVPIWIQEQGIGRGDPLWFTILANLFKRAGGNHFTTYFAQPTFVSSLKYFLHSESSSYAEFNFKEKNHHKLKFWSIPEKLIIGKFKSLLETIGRLSAILGRQKKLPEWVYNGVILGIQGGKEKVLDKLEKANKVDLKVCGVWCQDWQGIRFTSFGKQLKWDWIYDKKLYPRLPEFIRELHERGIKFLGYINPFLATDGKLYRVAKEKNYLVKNKQGEDYLIVTTTFSAGILDLSNEKTRLWIKKIIKGNFLKTGLDGWMVDYGEYLPTDAILATKEEAREYHNTFPVVWAKINKEVLEESNKEDGLFFTRAGFSEISRFSPLIWAGDQLVNWSIHDGLISVIPAGLSVGISGIGFYHFDIGGYTTIGPFRRSKEVLLRWMELAAFTMVMRTHEGNRPKDNWQFDSDIETIQHFSKMTKIHVVLKPYLLQLEKEYLEKGYPPMRACFLHYDDSNLYKLKFQFLLGKDLLIAPVIRKGRKKWKVYLPRDKWIH